MLPVVALLLVAPLELQETTLADLATRTSVSRRTAIAIRTQPRAGHRRSRRRRDLADARRASPASSNSSHASTSIRRFAPSSASPTTIDNLYVFARMFDPHPDSIMHALTRRDVRGSSDQIKLLIDSYNDKRSGFEFAVNPDGVKRDFSMSNDGNEDDSWDGVWDVATRVDSLGWTAEFRIPLSQLRYAKSESNTFGFGVWRDIERLNEREAWPRYSADAQRSRRRSSACSPGSPASPPAAASR